MKLKQTTTRNILITRGWNINRQIVAIERDDRASICKKTEGLREESGTRHPVPY